MGVFFLVFFLPLSLFLRCFERKINSVSEVPAKKGELTLPNKIDLTGWRFGKLTVLRPAENIGNKTAWICRCDCGKEIIAKTTHLREGNTKSCGCGGACAPLDLTGQRYGRLTVLRRAERIDGKTAWVCRCDCGNETIVKTACLRGGDTTSCGCLRKGNPLGLSFVDGTCVEFLRGRRIRSDNTSGATGVEWLEDKRLWRATINFKGKRRYLGAYRNFEDAVKVRKRAEEELFEPFLREFSAGQAGLV